MPEINFALKSKTSEGKVWQFSAHLVVENVKFHVLQRTLIFLNAVKALVRAMTGLRIISAENTVIHCLNLSQRSLINY
jgi:hypothetical protein